MHPLAEQGRKALESHYFSQAREFLTAAVEKHPTDCSILCEYLICESYFGNEETAAKRFSETKNTPRNHDLKLLLSRYYYCRQQLANKCGDTDVSANDWLSKHLYTPEKGIGIRISACLITKNEEKVLAKCLESLKGIVDEIVVVDTGSADNTVKIAESYGARLGNFEWVNDFSAARNAALEHATCEWALWIDADEQLDPSCLEAFAKGVIRPHLGGYSVKIINYMDDSGTVSEFIHTPTRLFRNIPGVTFTEPIHEQITPSLMKLGLPWTPLEDAVIHHDGYRTAAIEEKNKVERTITLLEQHVANNPEEPFQIFNLANAYFVGQEFDKAAKTAKRALKNLPIAGAEYGHAVYQVLSTSLGALGKHEEAERVCLDCSKSHYHSIVNEYIFANTLMNLGRFDEALSAVEQCLKSEWPKDIIGDKGIADFRRYALKGQILGCLSKWEESLVWFEEAMQRQPGFVPAIIGRAVALEHVGREDEAEQAYTSLSNDPSMKIHCERGLGAIAERRGEYAKASCHLENTWRLNTSDTEAFNKWLGVLEKMQRYDECLKALDEYAQIHEATVSLFTSIARIHEKAGRLDAALESYQCAINQDPNESNTWFTCGDLLYKVGAYPQALQVYETALRLKSDHADGWFVFGNCLAQMNHDDEAIQAYREALRLNPTHDRAARNLQTIQQAA
jgi:tetratricopeptide (TPR) repeat protein